MSRGNSGRVVLVVAPDLKRRLHSKVALEGISLKQWFVSQAEAYLDNSEPFDKMRDSLDRSNEELETDG